MCKAAIQAMNMACIKLDANPSSLHVHGSECKNALVHARAEMLRLIGPSLPSATIIFTSGCTESNNLAIQGIMNGGTSRSMVITTPIEHDSVLNVVKGLTYKLCAVDEQGYVIADSLADVCLKNKPDVLLVSIMAAQNELGTIQPLNMLVPFIRNLFDGDRRVVIHVDATQLFGKYAVSVTRDLGDPDLVTGSAHKFHGPKGVGFLYVRDKNTFDRLHPVNAGGGQEMGKRPGTENLSGIMSMVAALQHALSPNVYPIATKNMKTMKHYLLAGIDAVVPNHAYVLNGDVQHGLVNTINVTILYTNPDIVLAQLLSAAGICVSSASACTKTARSHVLAAIGVPPDHIAKTIRISLSRYNTMGECKQCIEYLDTLCHTTLSFAH